MKAITNTKYIKNIFLSALLFTAVATFAQEDEEEAPKFSFSGSIDAYYRANLNGDNSFDEASGLPNAAPGSSFANLPGFALGMANFVAGYEGEKAGFVADLVFGPRGTDAIFASPIYSATGNIVNQLYAYWNVSDAVTLTFGNFNTFLGYEVISPVANFNYSTSYLFSYGPFSHTGLKADFALSDDFSLMLAVMNQTDITELNVTGKYAYGLQLGYSGQYLNVLVDNGPFEIDYTGGFDLSDTFFLGLNAAYFDGDGAGSFAGAAIYPQLTTSENFAIGLRAEYFAETDSFGAIGASDAEGDASVFAVTLTGSATIGNLMIKPELRLDTASDESVNFLDSDLMAQKSLSSFVLAAIYSF
ncbi:outer membrane beta-barrel protein [Pseudozobellia thermophila]|uniref:Putative beta-barrel porin-2, OmpL-like. bbp2 n=1 Tax=Pseudozobellia thermophila TaxID=192903 RepID=A0A1M6HQS7_9FLAO|nr:outer membrane beta-barrel protein [Pseudozobellia thermophila]SHJ24444.1 Putative beta-barrel porin-2, OmpL-like. bbp2 [Pseudozobellia thermophila]